MKILANNKETFFKVQLTLRNFFHTQELLQLITSNFYSIFFYNSEIWHLKSLKCNLKQKLLSSSAKAIKICIKYCTNHISFTDIHNMFKRATPEKFLLYKLALSLFKLYNSPCYSLEWAALNFNQILTSRQTKLLAIRANKKKIGVNALGNILLSLTTESLFHGWTWHLRRTL